MSGGSFIGLAIPDAQATDAEVAASTAPPKLAGFSETHTAASFTDGLAGVGTKLMTGLVPIGAIMVAVTVQVTAGFAGDVSAVLEIGSVGVPDLYADSIDVFSIAPALVKAVSVVADGPPVAAFNPQLRVTAATDFTPLLAGGGSITVGIYYIQVA